jgi:hypothetical protein
MMRTKPLWAIVWIYIAARTASAQNVEVTGFNGGQTNGELDLSTASFQRIDVQNVINYGLGADYLLGERTSLEFLWNYNNADTVAEPRGGRPNSADGPGVRAKEGCRPRLRAPAEITRLTFSSARLGTGMRIATALSRTIRRAGVSHCRRIEARR